MTKEDLIFEIKRRCNLWLQNKTISKKNALGCLLGILEHEESQPSLPPNLDEAAENRVTENGRFEITPFEKMRIDDIMFGAEWMAGQGYTTTGRIIDEMAYYDIQFDELLPNNICDPKDKVVVQIRKK